MPLVYVNKAPGVYINEINEPGPIAGVSTSTAAFVGPAQSGESGNPTPLTNFTQFKHKFGDVMENYFVGYSVKGFFENGGANCYFVRVANASCTLEDQTGAPALMVSAKAEGEPGNRIKVEVKEASLLSDGKVYRAAAKLAEAKKDGKQATLSDPQDAAKFKKGDVVSIANKQSPQNVTIDEIKDGTITFAESLSDNYDGGNIRIADMAVGTVRIRVDKTDGMEKGSYVVVTQQKQGSAATMEKLVVSEVDGTNKFVTFQSGLSSSYPMAETDPPVTIKTVEFTITVETPDGLANAGSQTFENLSMESAHSRFVGKITNTANNVVITLVQGTLTAPPNNMPRSGTYQLSGGIDYKTAIDLLRALDDVNILCVPDAANREDWLDIQEHMVEHCEQLRDRFAILDARRGEDGQNQRKSLGSDRGYAALYYPWIVISNPSGNAPLKIPPSGHLAGVYAYTDSTRGVHKAPANQAIKGALNLEKALTDDEQGPLNEKGINVLRNFSGRGQVVWGARTIAPPEATQWRYINVRRLLIYIEVSLQRATRFAVFEPNNLALWQTVKRQVTAFLTEVWRSGALFGATQDEAFQVRIDEELNPPDQKDQGILVIEVKVAPVKPAEFIEFQIIQTSSISGLEQ